MLLMENTELIFNAVNFAKKNATENGISVEEVAKNAEEGLRPPHHRTEQCH